MTPKRHYGSKGSFIKTNDDADPAKPNGNIKDRAIGLFAGGGGNIVITNAGYDEFKGEGKVRTFNFNAGFVFRVFSLQVSGQNGIYVISIGPPIPGVPTGIGFGASFGTYEITTTKIR